MGLQLPKWLIKLSGDLYVHKFPFFLLYRPAHHRVTGPEVRKVLNALEDGDVLLRRYNGYLNTFFTPGFWGHAALYAGGNDVIHAVGEGVIREDILSFCRTDSVCVLRLHELNAEKLRTALAVADKAVKERIQYDYRFKGKNGKVYCTELVNECYGGEFEKDYENVAGNSILTPDGIRKSAKARMIVEFRH